MKGGGPSPERRNENRSPPVSDFAPIPECEVPDLFHGDP